MNTGPSLRSVGGDPGQIRADPGVDRWAAGQAVAAGLEHEGSDTGNVVTRSARAVDWATAVTVAGAGRVAGILDADVVGPDRRSGCLGRALGIAQNANAGLLQDVWQGVGGRSSAPSSNDTGLPSEVVAAGGQSGELNAASDTDGRRKGQDGDIVGIGGSTVVIILVQLVRGDSGCLGASSVGSVVKSSNYCQGVDGCSVNAVGSAEAATRGEEGGSTAVGTTSLLGQLPRPGARGRIGSTDDVRVDVLKGVRPNIARPGVTQTEQRQKRYE